ncbi:MAG: hypothetical protein ABFS18_12830 [Thermodesulfobacteriota bacterium]
MIRFLLIFWFIYYAIRHGAWPWRFFQLNAPYFNARKGIFSKLDIDNCIPPPWRLAQGPLTSELMPASFPVFFKPEWGQNSHGIFRADDPDEFQSGCRRVAGKDIDYIVQEAARETREFEVFYIRVAHEKNQHATFSITEVLNSGEDPLPINGIYNKNTGYHDCTSQFSADELEKIWSHFKAICEYRIARVGLRANSIEDLLAGVFHIIEINLFIPLPLSLLDTKMSWVRKISFIKTAMKHAARAVKAIPPEQDRKAIFWKKLAAHFRTTW